MFWPIVTVARDRLLWAKMQIISAIVSMAIVAMGQITDYISNSCYGADPSNQSLATIAVVLLWKVS